MSDTPTTKEPKFYSIPDLAERWRCSPTTARRKLIANNIEVFDMADPGEKGKKLVPAKAVRKMESSKTRTIGKNTA